jgi:hypothetical protein
LITSKQAIKACLLAQALSNGYKPIQLFRYDSQEKYIYILAGEEETIQVKIFPDGNWRFLND